MNIWKHTSILIALFLFLPVVSFAKYPEKGNPAGKNPSGQTLSEFQSLAGYDRIARKAETYFKDAAYFKAAGCAAAALRQIELMKDTAKSDYFRKVHSDLLFWYGYSLAHTGRHDEASRQFYEILRLYGKNESSVYSFKAYRGLGMVSGMRSKQVKANEYFRKCLAIARREKDYDGICGILSNMGVLHLQKLRPDSALVYFLEANKVAVEHRDQCDQARIFYLMGAAYCYLGQLKLSREYLQNAIPIAEKRGDRRLILFIQNSLIHNLVKEGDDIRAKAECLKHYRMAGKFGARDLEAAALATLSGIYSREGNYKKAFEYLSLSRSKSDSLFSKESEERLEAQQADFEHYKLEQAREMMRKDVQLAEITVEKRNLWIVILVAVVCIASVALIWLSRRAVIQCRINNLLKKKIAHLKEQQNLRFDAVQCRLGEEADSKNKELILSLLLQVNVKDTISEVLQKLHLLQRSFSSAGKESVVIGEMKSLLDRLNVDKDWSTFQLYFEQVNDGFFRNLSEAFPNLTSGDKRLCALISLNLTTKEIASLIDRSVRGVETAKFRLKKKMQLSPEESLTDILLKIKEK